MSVVLAGTVCRPKVHEGMTRYRREYLRRTSVAISARRRRLNWIPRPRPPLRWALRYLFSSPVRMTYLYPFLAAAPVTPLVGYFVYRTSPAIAVRADTHKWSRV